MARDVDFNVTASDRTGNALNSAARRVKKTEADTKKSLSGLSAGVVDLASRISPKLGASIAKGLQTGAEAAAPAAAAMVAYAAPVLAAGLSAAVVGGVGIGGVVGGLAIASKSPAVQAAGKQLSEHIGDRLEESAQPFVPAALAAIGQVEAGFDGMAGKLDRIFAESATFVQPLTSGVLRGIEGVIDGVERVTAVARPTIDALSDGIADMGVATGDFLATVAGDGETAAAITRDITENVSGLLYVIGPVIAGLRELYGALDSIGALTSIGDLVTNIRMLTAEEIKPGELSTGIMQVANSFVNAATAAQGYSVDLAAVKAAQQALTNNNLSLYEAQTRAAQATRDATKAIQENGEGLDLNSKNGLENRAVLGQLAGALNTSYEQYVKVHGAGQGANEVMAQNRAAFIAAASSADRASGAAARLADQLIGVPDRTVKVDMLDKATGKINNVINRLAAVRDKTVTLKVAVSQSADAAALRKQNQTSVSNAALTQSAGPDPGRRTGGPAPINVTNRTVVTLDGRPFAAYTARSIYDSNARDSFRQRVGTI